MSDVCTVNIPVPGVPFDVPSTDGTYIINQVDPTQLTLVQGIFKGTWVAGGHYFPSNMIVDANWLLWLCIYENRDFFLSGPNWAVLFDLSDSAGPVGPQGPVGAQGPIGPQGIQGPAGANGTNGADGAPGGVVTFQGRSGNVTLLLTDVTGVGGAPNDSPLLTGNARAVTPVVADSSTKIATTAFVAAAVAGMNTVNSFNARKGDVLLTLADITGVGGAPLASPAFSGSPTAPTPGAGDNSTKLATTAFVNSKVTGLYLPLTGGTLSAPGNLNAGLIASNSSIQVNVVAGQNALYWMNVPGKKQFYHGLNVNGQYVIVDNTANVARWYINTDGSVLNPGNLTVSGALVVSGALTTSGDITLGGNIVGNNDGAIQISSPAANHARFFSTVAGARSWAFGCISNGAFWLGDLTAGAARINIDTAGNITIYQSLVVGVNLTVNGQINSGALFPASINVAGSSTLNGPVACNAISCSTINTNNNNVTMGVGDLSCQVITASDAVHCVHGVQYTDLGNHCIGFNNAGTTLTFFALGGSSGSWNFSSSDERTKEGIAPAIGDPLGELNTLNLISYDLPLPDLPTKHFNFGFSAQNVKLRIPEAVTEILLPDGEDRLVLDTLPLLARCVGAIQQLLGRVAALEARLAA